MSNLPKIYPALVPFGRRHIDNPEAWGVMHKPGHGCIPAAFFDGCCEKEAVTQLGRETMPTGVEARVCEFIATRQQFGLNKYGTSVEANPLSVVQWLQHFREELADALIYATKAQEKLIEQMDDGK